MCNLSWTPHSNLESLVEKDNSPKNTPVLAQRWADGTGSIGPTKNDRDRVKFDRVTASDVCHRVAATAKQPGAPTGVNGIANVPKRSCAPAGFDFEPRTTRCKI